jgi:quaternary ammonium compound-resistance protein SugE
MGGLAWAMKSLPVGTAYAVWVGVGASITILYSFAAGEEAVTTLKIIFLLMIVAGIIGLRVVN